MRPIASAALATCTAVLMLLVSERTSASDRFNFSGKYVEETKDKLEGISTLEVSQNNENIDITIVKFGKRTVYHCPLNGSDGDYTRADGLTGKCKLKQEPKYLILESVVLTRSAHDPPRHILKKEKWYLSSDRKTLTVDYAVEFPDLSPDLLRRLRAKISGTEKYKRTNP